MKKLVRIVVAGVALACVAPRRALADTVAVADLSSAVVFADDGDAWELEGPNFDFETFIRRSFSIPAVGAGGCLGTDLSGSSTPCHPGDVIDESAQTLGTGNLGFGPATLNGTNYGDVTYSGSFKFTAAPVTFPQTTANAVLLSAPITFTGQISGFSNGSQVFDVLLTGQGATSRTFFGPVDYFYQSLGSTAFTFSLGPSTPAPTPEPASLLLLGTGLAGIGALRRKRRAP